ncbi:TPA: hypothetical protein ACOFD8_003278 [Stenotrophomonas maltophilia]
MTTDKTPATLATVKHGGCVQLPSSERERFEAWARTHHRLGESGYLEREQLSGDYRLQPTDYAWRAWQAALSAQPSPGGQGGFNYERMFVDACAALAEVSRELGCDPEQGGAEPILAAIAELREALSARQPVCNVDGTWLWSKLMDWCKKMGASPASHNELFAIAKEAHALAARQPVGELAGYATFRDGRFGSWLFQTRAMAESHDSTAVAGGPANSEIVPLFRSPAQAVDLGPVRALLQRRIEQWRSHLPADPGAPGTREIETKGEHDYNNDVRIYREGIVVMEEVLALIDGHAEPAHG